jgi:hypothetical protein
VTGLATGRNEEIEAGKPSAGSEALPAGFATHYSVAICGLGDTWNPSDLDASDNYSQIIQLVSQLATGKVDFEAEAEDEDIVRRESKDFEAWGDKGPGKGFFDCFACDDVCSKTPPQARQ